MPRHVRRLTGDDVNAVAALEREAFAPELHESADALRRLIELFPEGAFGCFDEDGLCGFAFGVPLRAGTTLALGLPLDEVPQDADTFYIHDVAVASRCRRLGVGRLLAGHLLSAARARGLRRAELVSVQGSAPFWARFGFAEIERIRYGDGVVALRMAASL
jgi:ribosomal protein S18 acetylase RimI-like enzyme